MELKEKVAEGVTKKNIEGKMAQDALRSKRDYSTWVVDGTPAVVCGISPDGTTTFINPSGERITGYSAREIVGKNWWHVFYPGDEYRQVDQLFRDFEEEDVRDYEMILTTKQGEKRVISWNSVNRIDETGRILEVIGIGVDITERRQLEDKLKQTLEEVRSLSLTDDLTKLCNRRGFTTLAEQQLKIAYRNKMGMAVFFVDLDGMKQINDALGHEEGDLALIAVANILRETFRDSDIIARLGGDEFAVLALETSKASAAMLMKRFFSNLEAHNAKGKNSRKLSVSVGVAAYNPALPCSLDELLARADKGMYDRKRNKTKFLIEDGSLTTGKGPVFWFSRPSGV